jgi:hypothetical protein
MGNPASLAGTMDFRQHDDARPGRQAAPVVLMKTWEI